MSDKNLFAMSNVEANMEPVKCFLLTDETNPEEVKRSVLIPGPNRLYKQGKIDWDIIINGQGGMEYDWHQAKPEIYTQLENGKNIEGLEKLTIVPINIGINFVKSAQATFPDLMLDYIAQYYTELLNKGKKMQAGS